VDEGERKDALLAYDHFLPAVKKTGAGRSKGENSRKEVKGKWDRRRLRGPWLSRVLSVF